MSDYNLRERCERLQKFKDWVHTYLDSHGVPHHPHGVHGAGGCRVGDRMDWLMNRLELLEGVQEKIAVRLAIGTLREVKAAVETELGRGYVLTHEPLAGELWRRRWNDLLGKVEATVKKIEG